MCIRDSVGAMCWEESDPRKAFGVDKRELAWIMGAHPQMKVLEVRNYVRRHWDKTWDLPFCNDFCNLWGGQMNPMDVLRLAKRYRLDPDRMLRYFDGVFVQNEDYYCTLFELYRDYLDAAYALGRCMEHSAVLWPEQLYTAHDVAVAELADTQARTEAVSYTHLDVYKRQAGGSGQPGALDPPDQRSGREPGPRICLPGGEGEIVWVRERYSSAGKKHLPPCTGRWPRTSA